MALAEIYGPIIAGNTNMLRLMRGLGSATKPCLEDPDFRLADKAL